MTCLSVNINKVALIRNSRPGNFPDLYQFARDCEEYGADGITVHPRPDERHIRYSDIPVLKEIVTTEFNIEGYPSKEFLQLVGDNPPHQCTLVPDPPGVLTSSEGWDTITNADLLKDVISFMHSHNIRVSLFLDPIPKFIEGAKNVGADRIELYTGDFAKAFKKDKNNVISAHIEASKIAKSMKLGLNAGHDLNLENLSYYRSSVLDLKEVSIGHALIADSLYFGIHNTIQLYKRELNKNTG